MTCCVSFHDYYSKSREMGKCISLSNKGIFINGILLKELSEN